MGDNQKNEILSGEIMDVISDLKSGKKDSLLIPDRYNDDLNIALVERELKMRRTGFRGYDILSKSFFVEEDLIGKAGIRKRKTTFSDFQSYYDFVDGDIYSNACYYQCEIPTNTNINIDKWNSCEAFIDETINDYQYPYRNNNLYGDDENIEYKIIKEYKGNAFYVHQIWFENDEEIWREEHRFKYFFDFVHFLEGDLTDADLIFCEGLENLRDISGINFAEASMKSMVLDRFGLPYEHYSLPEKNIDCFSTSYNNEQTSSLSLQLDDHKYDYRDADAFTRIIGYVSDLHLMHILQKSEICSENDLIYCIDKIAYSFVADDRLLLIGGDVCSEFSFFEMFVKALKRYNSSSRQIVFVLGNHELWSFPNKTIDEIVSAYRNLLSEYGMYLLHNNILYSENGNLSDKLHEITTEELLEGGYDFIQKHIDKARCVLFGGLAFSGCDTSFNAKNGIYRNVVSREEEIKQSQLFKKLYDKVSQVASDKKVIVLTHTPMECWSDSVQYIPNFVYVSGHTHKNYFYDDGETRIYADNQLGYNCLNPNIKKFKLDITYDLFKNCEDGIHIVSKDDYYFFLLGKCMACSTSRIPEHIYMLKKSNYYCFIRKTAAGGLSILNGGRSKGLAHKDINHYYNEMDMVIKKIEEPLVKYSRIQQQISDEIKSIGGNGKIHGCIIDIDFFNHVFLNPLDLKATGYYATNIIDKIVYPNVSMLLQERCPKLYGRYSEMISDKQNTLPILNHPAENTDDLLPRVEDNTDIYKMSADLKKMQRLRNNVLSIWTEPSFRKELDDMINTAITE